MRAGREGSPSGKALSSQSDGDPTEGQSFSLAPTPTGLLVLLARLFSPSLSSGQGGWLEQDRAIGGVGVGKGVLWAWPGDSQVETAWRACLYRAQVRSRLWDPRQVDTSKLGLSGLTIFCPSYRLAPPRGLLEPRVGLLLAQLQGGATYTEGNLLPSLFSSVLQALEQQQDHRPPEGSLPGTVPAGEIVSTRAGWAREDEGC